ncbi:MAG TPA: TetR/AcrR family transcriptional regulator [Bacillota bacterium]|jgi:TetR/AcrR family transcriptional regulator|nr:TetR/AcrR family transcriptional regulator [Bacillota bacterium]
MARNQSQNERMREERKEQILSGALRLFATKGFFAAKIKDIAQEVGMAQGLVYHYYSSKDEIYVELIRNALEKLNMAVQMLKEMPQPPHEKIKMAIVHLLKTIESSDDFSQTCRLIAHAMNSTAIPEDARRLIEEKRDIPYREIAKIMADGQKEGTIIEADPYELAVVFWTSINGLAIYKATRPEGAAVPDANILIGMFMKE